MANSDTERLPVITNTAGKRSCTKRVQFCSVTNNPISKVTNILVSRAKLSYLPYWRVASTNGRSVDTFDSILSECNNPLEVHCLIFFDDSVPINRLLWRRRSRVFDATKSASSFRSAIIDLPHRRYLRRAVQAQRT